MKTLRSIPTTSERKLSPAVVAAWEAAKPYLARLSDDPIQAASLLRGQQFVSSMLGPPRDERRHQACARLLAAVYGTVIPTSARMTRALSPVRFCDLGILQVASSSSGRTHP